jgi:hypothetical protein
MVFQALNSKMRYQLELDDQSMDMNAVKDGIRKVNAAYLHNPAKAEISNGPGVWHPIRVQRTKYQYVAKSYLDAMEDRADELEQWLPIREIGIGDCGRETVRRFQRDISACRPHDLLFIFQTYLHIVCIYEDSSRISSFCPK